MTNLRMHSAVVGLMLAISPAAASPKVLATIAPIHSLLSSVMHDVAVPDLLLSSNVSPHSYSLKPSDARRLASAGLIVAVGPTFEAFLEKPLAHLARNARIVMLTRDAQIKLLVSSTDHHHNPSHTDDHAAINPHVWLDPINAVAMVDHLAAVLGEIDPNNLQRYRLNATKLISQLHELDRSLKSAFTDVRNTPFMVSHDAYTYLVTRYGLNMVGAFHKKLEQAPGAKHLAELRTRIKRLGVRCIFSEPQFSSRIVMASLKWAGVRSAVLDPLGIDIATGPGAYETLMRRLGATLANCLTLR